MNTKEPKKTLCPNCKTEMSCLMLFGKIPDFWSCPNCKQTFDPETLSPLGFNVIVI